MQQTEPQIRISYLDANFPFKDGFPLLPHLSHDDGRKVDIAFMYRYQSDDSLRKKGEFLSGIRCLRRPKGWRN